MAVDLAFLEQQFSVKDQVAVVTGGMGQLGRRFTETLARGGAKIVVLDKKVSQPHSFLVELEKEFSIVYVEADITNKNQLLEKMEWIENEVGLVSILVNNAALDSPPNAPVEETGPFETYPEESWDRVLEVNLKGIFLTCQVFGARMAEREYGRIVNISSIYGALSPNQTIYEYRNQDGNSPFFKPVAYSVSKSGVFNLTRYLATLWAKKNVHVNTLTLAGVFNNQDEQFLENYCSLNPKGRMAKEDEYMGTLLMLCSKAASYLTGSNIVVDGGWTAW